LAAGAPRLLPRLAWAAVALACAPFAHAQFVGTLALASQNRYRGTATDDVGPVARASVMGDTTFGLYGGVSGLWRTRDGELSQADELVGWSGRLNRFDALADIDPAWAWDLAWHHTHYGESAQYDFSEGMVGLVAPGVSARLWWSPHYFGSDWSSLYAELDASRDLDPHWRAFAHVGYLHYGPGADGRRPPGRTDASAGAAWVGDGWDVRLARDGLVSGRAFDGVSRSSRRPGWVLSGSVSF